MSDPSPEEQRDIEEAAAARDGRMGLIRQSIDVEVEMRDSPTWRYIRDRIEQEKAEISNALAAMGDRASLNQLQARAIACEMIPRWIEELIGSAASAYNQIRIEDGHFAPTD